MKGTPVSLPCPMMDLRMVMSRRARAATEGGR